MNFVMYMFSALTVHEGLDPGKYGYPSGSDRTPQA